MDYELRKAVENSPCGRFIRYNEKLVGGAYKDVYVGFDRVENIEVAWNQIDFEGAYDEEAREILLKLYTEAHILKHLKHESIIMCFSRLFDSEAKTISVITELFPSISLRKLRRTKSKCDGAVSGIDLAAIKNWGRQILEGLNFLHSQNPKIVHRDIKCDNIFVHSGGKQVKLGGFGLAIRLIEGNFAKELIKGNSAFMAPEYYDEKYNELVDNAFS
ncbi:serine/threonine-protein kinase WNK8-like [Nicotiana tabacum]|uniref:non-specific serine/threonine protein kinase n=2 Tax=Nicotiana TaxID=4085 RepID=A0A1S3Z452_TOBAC|nr:PREDICTED: serine/threonine-protein kinase WNK8-like [Nicotiana sylvestris]XP_016459168.1 PREDICTED: serine/threonine-protein kinase WNK8-like [Nicotiana tabacum]